MALVRGVRPAVVLCVLVVLVTLVGWQASRLDERNILDARFKELTAIGKLKAEEIASWRSERLHGASMLAHDPLFAQVVDRWLSQPADGTTRQLVADHLSSLCRDLGYSNAFLVAPGGNMLMSALAPGAELDPETRRAVDEAMKSGQAALGEFYRCDGCRTAHIDAAAPVGTASHRAALVLRSDADRQLYPLLLSWPTPSTSAGTLLVRVDRGTLVFLTEPRPQPQTPVRLSGPLSPAAAAVVHGKVGPFEGRDYRGVEVLTDVRHVPGTSWFIVAKIDRQEALQEAQYRSRLIAMAVVLAVALIATLWAYFIRRRAQARDKWLSSILEKSLNEIYVVDVDTQRFKYVSRGALFQLGYTLEEMRALTPLDLIPQMTAESLAKLNAPIYSGEKPLVEVETVHRRKDGSCYDALMVIQLIERSDGKADIVAIGQDISSRKRLERELEHAQRLEAVGRLAGGVAHDFNNLLTVINNYAEFGLEQLPTDHPFCRDLQQIRAAGERATVLTRQLLAFSRKQVLQPQVLDLNVVVSNLRPMLARLLGEDLELVTRAGLDVPRVMADRGQVEQVVMNLAVNARDAMPGGGVLTIETGSTVLDGSHETADGRVRAGKYVFFSVTDTGTGMSEEVRQHLFEPFFTTKPTGKGTGLGLATIYGIVKQSGGTVSVRTELGKGSTFTVYLPATSSEQSSNASAGDGRVPTARKDETILLAEDEASVRDLARRVLENAGYKVLVAADASDANRIAATAARIDILLTDVVMPHISGRELADDVLKARPNAKVLYMSGYTETEISDRGLTGGRVHLIAKPFTGSELARKVRSVLDGASGDFEVERA